jgi:hypothetical protein
MGSCRLGNGGSRPPPWKGGVWGWVGLLADVALAKQPTHPRPLPFREGGRSGSIWRSVKGCRRTSEAFATPSIVKGFCRRGGVAELWCSTIVTAGGGEDEGTPLAVSASVTLVLFFITAHVCRRFCGTVDAGTSPA